MGDAHKPTPDPKATMSGADILVHSLVRHGVEVVFAYPGGASMPIHQSLTRIQDKIRTILPRHEQGGITVRAGAWRGTVAFPAGARGGGQEDGEGRGGAANAGHDGSGVGGRRASAGPDGAATRARRGDEPHREPSV